MVAMIKDQRELIKARNSEITETRREIKENEKRIKHQAAEIQKCEHQIQVYDETNAAEVRLRYDFLFVLFLTVLAINCTRRTSGLRLTRACSASKDRMISQTPTRKRQRRT